MWQVLYPIGWLTLYGLTEGIINEWLNEWISGSEEVTLLISRTGSQDLNTGIWYRYYAAKFNAPSHDTNNKCVVQEMTLDNSRQTQAIYAPYLDHNLCLCLVLWLRLLVLFLYPVEISVFDARHVTNRGIQSTLDCDIYCQTEHLIVASTAKHNINIFYCICILLNGKCF